jgi:hypothetical protein
MPLALGAQLGHYQIQSLKFERRKRGFLADFGCGHLIDGHSGADVRSVGALRMYAVQVAAL